MMMSAGRETYTALLSAAETGNDVFKMVGRIVGVRLAYAPENADLDHSDS